MSRKKQSAEATAVRRIMNGSREIDWSRINYDYSNFTLADLLGVTHETVSRMRTRHARKDQRGAPGKSSGEPAHHVHVNTARYARELVAELAQGAPNPNTIHGLQLNLNALVAVEQSYADTGSRTREVSA